MELERAKVEQDEVTEASSEGDDGYIYAVLGSLARAAQLDEAGGDVVLLLPTTRIRSLTMDVSRLGSRPLALVKKQDKDMMEQYLVIGESPGPVKF